MKIALLKMSLSLMYKIKYILQKTKKNKNKKPKKRGNHGGAPQLCLLENLLWESSWWKLQLLHLQVHCRVHASPPCPGLLPSSDCLLEGLELGCSSPCRTPLIDSLCFPFPSPHQPCQDLLWGSSSLDPPSFPPSFTGVRPAFGSACSPCLLLLRFPFILHGCFPRKLLACLFLSWCQFLGGPELV